MNEELKKRLLELGMTEEHIAKLEAQGAKEDRHISRYTVETLMTDTECGRVIAQDVVEAFTPPPVPAVEAPQVFDPASSSVLPTVLDDTSFIAALKVGGMLKIEPVDVISAMKAAIAGDVGLFDLPKTILTKMEEFADAQAEPVGEAFYTLRKLVAQRNYGELFSAMGIDGNFISQGRKDAVLTRLDTKLWPALRGFHQMLTQWAETWSSSAGSPAAILSMIAMSQGGARGPMPPGIMTVPETTGLRDEAEGVINEINSVFAGTGIPVARALAWEANRIKGILTESSLPAALGVTTTDQMLKLLGVAVGADYVRLERNVTTYALSVMEFPQVASGDAEYAYLSALLQLGAAIPWDKLHTGQRQRPARKGGGSSHDDSFPEEE